MEPSRHDSSEPGSAQDILTRLLSWCRRTDKGLARVEFHSDVIRRQVDEALGRGLAAEKIAFHEIMLPAARTPFQLVMTLRERLESLEPGVVSLAGLDKAFSPGLPLQEALPALNFNRENLALPGLRQIWWMTPEFTDAFLRIVPDLASWFMVRLRLTELPQVPALSTSPKSERQMALLEDAHRRAAILVTRFRNAQALGTSQEGLQRLATAAIRALSDAGAEAEANALAAELAKDLGLPAIAAKVFISYSHDSREHEAQVLELTNRLRSDGVDAVVDQYEPTPPENWSSWVDRNIRDADFVLIICTPNYQRRMIGESVPGTGLGGLWEGGLITNYLYRHGELNTKFIPVVMHAEDRISIPTSLQAMTYYDLSQPSGYDSLYRRLTSQQSKA